VISEVDPLKDLSALSDPDKTLAAIVADGRPIRNRMDT
jgi:hypothetical protein